MSKLQRSNIYFLILVLLTIFLPEYLIKTYLLIGIKDIRVMQFLNHVILFLVPAIIYIIVTKVNIKETFRLNKIHLKDLLLIILISFVCYPLMGCISAISQMFFTNNVGTFMAAIADTPYWAMLLLMAVTPAITEEITLRGVVLSGYDNQSKFKAALITGILFGIFHMDFQQFLYATALGFIFAYIVRITNSIFSSVIMHFIINGISVTAQKVLFSAEELISQVVEEPSLMDLSFNMKLTYMSTYILVGVAFGVLVYKLIHKLEVWNIERQGVPDEIGESNYLRDVSDEPKESVINWSFILIVVIYLSFMIYDVYIR